MSLPITLLLIASVTATSLISGVFGMAGGMILLWILFGFLPVGAAIAIQGIIQMIANGSRAIMVRDYVDWGILARMLSGLAAAAILLALFRYEPDLRTICIIIGLLPILVWIPKSWLALDASKPLHAYLNGFLGGLLNLSVGVAGPIMDIFFIRTDMDRRRVIATKAAMQVLSHLAKVVFYAGATFALEADLWVALAIAAPFAVIGTWMGNVILHRITDAGFRRWTRYIVTAIGLVFLLRGFGLLA